MIGKKKAAKRKQESFKYKALCKSVCCCVHIHGGDPSGGHCTEEDGVSAADLRRTDTDSAAEDGF